MATTCNIWICISWCTICGVALERNSVSNAYSFLLLVQNDLFLILLSSLISELFLKNNVETYKPTFYLIKQISVNKVTTSSQIKPKTEDRAKTKTVF